MNPRTTAILLAVALALGAFIYWYEIGGEDARLEAEQRAKQLFPEVEESDVAWIELVTKDGVDARFERRGEDWRLVRPVDFPADAAVGRFAETLATVTSESVFDDPQPPEEYGLDEASAKIVRFGTGETQHELRFGNTTPVGSGTYAATGDSKAVYTVATYRKTGFDKSLADLRDKQILDFDRNAIRQVEVRWPGAHVSLGYNEGGGPGTWAMTVPLHTRADDSAVSDLLSTLSFLRADGFVDEPTDAERALLEPPDLEVALVPEGEGAEPLRLAIGRPNAEGKRLVRAAGPTLFVIPAERLDDFPREVVAYRYRKLAQFELSDARQIEFFFHPPVGDPVAITATLGDDGWTSTPEAFADRKLARLVSELSRLNADDILAEEMGQDELEEIGLSPPNTIITVFGERPKAEAEAEPEAEEAEGEGEAEAEPAGAPRLAEIHLGRVTVDGIVASKSDDPIVYRLAPELAEHIPVDLAAFRSRFRAEPKSKPEPEDEGVGAGPADELPSPREESP